MDKERFELGLAQRKGTLGAEYVETNLASADDFVSSPGWAAEISDIFTCLMSVFCEFISEFVSRWQRCNTLAGAENKRILACVGCRVVQFSIKAPRAWRSSVAARLSPSAHPPIRRSAPTTAPPQSPTAWRNLSRVDALAAM